MIAIGRNMPAWVADGWNVYARRLPKHLRVTLIEVPTAAKSSTEPLQDVEAAALLARCKRPGQVIALDENGTSWTTRQFAGRLEQWQMSGDAVNLLVGGAAGHGDAVRRRADFQWSLGRLTLPHMLVRVILSEQIYRAHTLITGHPYHRD
ncbi:MAG: 23S rRNA (pseudouridine(1915)-N(3))-methyltransferase RlmH [Xanthomonadaceae bacterium]|nr:23S rRNA (pseudouridine(1915)-N(3))-methyltransferase RlmH [Xanthomonadaceae bacterium]